VNSDAPTVLVLDELQFVDTLVEPQGGPVFPEMVAEFVGDFLVDERQQPMTLVDQRYPNA